MSDNKIQITKQTVEQNENVKAVIRLFREKSEYTVTVTVETRSGEELWSDSMVTTVYNINFTARSLLGNLLDEYERHKHNEPKALSNFNSAIEEYA